MVQVRLVGGARDERVLLLNDLPRGDQPLQGDRGRLRRIGQDGVDADAFSRKANRAAISRGYYGELGVRVNDSAGRAANLP